MSQPIPTDIVDQILGPTAAARLRPVRDAKPVTRHNTHESYNELFSLPHILKTSGGQAPQPTLAERLAIALFVVIQYRSNGLAHHFRHRLEAEGATDLAAVVADEAVRVQTRGPFGHYQEEGLRAEDSDGERYIPAPALGDAVGARLAAFLGQAHLLVYRPREASSADLQRLLNQGWSGTEIVTGSQIVAYLSYLTRLLAGLTALDQQLESAGVEPAIRPAADPHAQPTGYPPLE